MAKAKFEAVFTADASGFFSVSDKVQTELDQTTVDAKEAQAALAGIGSGAQDVGKKIPKAGAGLDKFGNSAFKSTYHMTNFSRVISDAPFGFIAISNNIEPMIASMGAMRAEAKLAGKGMASFMATSFLSPAGLVTILPAIGAALLVLSQQFDWFGDSTEEAGVKAEESADKIKSAFSKLSTIEFDIAGLSLTGDDLPATIGVVEQQIKDATSELGNLQNGRQQTFDDYIRNAGTMTDAEIALSEQVLANDDKSIQLTNIRLEQLTVILGELQGQNEKYKAQLSIRNAMLEVGYSEEDTQASLSKLAKETGKQKKNEAKTMREILSLSQRLRALYFERLQAVTDTTQALKDELAFTLSSEGQKIILLEAGNDKLRERIKLLNTVFSTTGAIDPSTGNIGQAGITGLPTGLLANQTHADTPENTFAGGFVSWYTDEGTQQMIQATQMMTSSMTSLFSQMTQSISSELQQAQTMYNQAVQAGNVSQQRMLRANMARLEKERKENFKRQKAWGIATATINTAVGITSALTSAPPNVPLAVAVGLAGAVQIASIASQKLGSTSGIRGASGVSGRSFASGQQQSQFSDSAGRPASFRTQQVRLADPSQPTIKVHITGRIETNNTALAVAVDSGNETLGRVRG